MSHFLADDTAEAYTSDGSVDDGSPWQGGWSGGFEEPIFHFSGVTVAPGTVITSAVLIGHSWGADNNTGTIKSTIRGDLGANPVMCTDVTDFAGRPRTVAGTNWTLNPIAYGGSILSPDLSAVIQEIVNDSSWASGNALQLLLDDNGSDDNTDFLWDPTAVTLWINEAPPPEPSVTSYSPHSGVPGVTTITITGDHLDQVADLQLNSTPIPFTLVDIHTLTFLIPSTQPCGSNRLDLIATDASDISPGRVMVAPEVVGITPRKGVPGQRVSLIGSFGLSLITDIQVAGTSLAFTIVSDTLVQFTMPDLGLRPGDVVAVDWFSANCSGGYTFRYGPGMVSSCSEGTGPAPPGSTVLITGWGFSTVTGVRFSLVIDAPSFTVLDDTHMIVELPELPSGFFITGYSPYELDVSLDHGATWNAVYDDGAFGIVFGPKYSIVVAESSGSPAYLDTWPYGQGLARIFTWNSSSALVVASASGGDTDPGFVYMVGRVEYPTGSPLNPSALVNVDPGVARLNYVAAAFNDSFMGVPSGEITYNLFIEVVHQIAGVVSIADNQDSGIPRRTGIPWVSEDGLYLAPCGSNRVFGAFGTTIDQHLVYWIWETDGSGVISLVSPTDYGLPYKEVWTSPETPTTTLVWVNSITWIDDEHIVVTWIDAASGGGGLPHGYIGLFVISGTSATLTDVQVYNAGFGEDAQVPLSTARLSSTLVAIYWDPYRSGSSFAGWDYLQGWEIDRVAETLSFVASSKGLAQNNPYNALPAGFTIARFDDTKVVLFTYAGTTGPYGSYISVWDCSGTLEPGVAMRLTDGVILAPLGPIWTAIGAESGVSGSTLTARIICSGESSHPSTGLIEIHDVEVTLDPVPLQSACPVTQPMRYIGRLIG